MTLSPQNELSYLGVRAKNPPDFIEATRSPTAADNTFQVGTIWMNTVALVTFEWSGATWIALGTGAVGGVATLTGDAGGPIAPAAGNINVIGTAAQGITSSGAGNTITFTVANASTIQKGVVALATNAETIAGAVTTKAVTPDDLKAKLGTQTDHGVLVARGTAAAVDALAVGTNGQLLIGSTGANPVFATLTAGTGITTVTGAGSLTINAVGGGTSFVAPVGAAQPMVVNTTYVANQAGLLTFTLPAAASASAGDVIRVIGFGAGGWQIDQNALQQIIVNATPSTVGVLGNAFSTASTDGITIQCIDAGLTWIATDIVGGPSAA